MYIYLSAFIYLFIGYGSSDKKGNPVTRLMLIGLKFILIAPTKKSPGLSEIIWTGLLILLKKKIQNWQKVNEYKH